MRRGRIKIDPKAGSYAYHCINRINGGLYLLKEKEKKVLRSMIWKVAEACGVKVLTYCILTNHFHVLVRVPMKEQLSDEELLRRYALLHSIASDYQTTSIKVIRSWLVANSEKGVRWRESQMRLMNDVSSYMKILKQRFAIWYNRTHERFGTLWAERFKSVLVEDGEGLERVATYIDLNCVRLKRPKNPRCYRFCGFAEAVAGKEEAQQGLQDVFGGQWLQLEKEYEMRLMGSSLVGTGVARVDASADTSGARLSWPDVLRRRIPHFSEGRVLGSYEFVAKQLSIYREKYGLKRQRLPGDLPSIADWQGLRVFYSPNANGR